MKRLLVLPLFLCLASCAGVTTYVDTAPDTGTHVRLLRTMGGELASPGIDEIAAQEAKLPGVTLVKVYEYTQTQQVADEISAEPASVREVIEGGSCGANASPVAAAGTRHVIAMVAVIQASEWCGGLTPLGANVLAAQETYNPDCADTLGLGCAIMTTGPGFPPSRFTVIVRPDCHPCAFVNPDAQADMVDAVRSVTTASGRLALRVGKTPGRINFIVRHHGERIR